jgi:hypothetical protein
MKSFKSSLSLLTAVFSMLLALAGSASAQLVAYDDAGNYLITANWTNGANQGFGFTPWVIATNGSDFLGTYVTSANSPAFVIASVTNVAGSNYTDVWGLFANGTNAINQTTAYRGFAAPLDTNTFKLQWGSRGAGVTTVNGQGQVHGWCGFSLRNGNATNSAADFQTGVRFYLYFLDGASPSTLYVWDGNGVQSIPGTSFSDLGRGNITNAIEAELTPGADGSSYHLVLKDCVQNRTLYTLDSVLTGSGTIDSVALFCDETTGDQDYNRMQIAVPRIPPTIANVQPADGSIYLDPNATSLSFEVDSFDSTVVSNLVNVFLNGVAQTSLTFNTASPASQLLVSCAATIAPDTFYNYTITAQDAGGNVVSNNYTFNTFLPGDLYVDASDYNYNSGQFINSSTPANAYANQLGSNGVDYLITDLAGTNNTAGYRPGDLPAVLTLATDATGDPVDHAGLRANGYTAYNIGFTDAGTWENYTRVMPSAASYSIYARAASAGSGQFEIEELVNATATVSNQPVAALGRVNVPATGGSRVFSGQLMPLADLFGNTVAVPLAGTRTIRCTAISSRAYNLEYLVFVPVTGATSPLRPYIAAGSPAPNATGVATTSKIAFTIVNRDTTVTNVQLFLNGNATVGLLLTNTTLATTVFCTNNLPASFTNSVTAVVADSAGVSTTNSWTFITAPLAGSGVWSGGGAPNLNWNIAANWTGGVPGPSNTAAFASPGATTTPVTNNIVPSSVTIQTLYYETNASGYHTTWIQDGVTLTVTNGTTSTTPVLQVGAGANSDLVFNTPVTNTITGNGGTLLLLGNPLGSGLANQLNFQVRQCANPAAPNMVTLDMSGLGTLVATVGKFTVGQGGTAVGQSNVSACVYLARTNVITLLRNTSGQFALGDSSGATNLPGSTLNLGITNAFFVDTMFVGNRRATNNLMRFNPAFTSITAPAAYFRGSNGLANSRVTSWNIADTSTEGFTPANAQANVDFSGGKLDALVGTMIVARGGTNSNDTGAAQGTLTFTGGTLDVNNLTNGVQRTNNTTTQSGIINVNGTATLLSPNIVIAQAAAGGNASLVTGTLNITNGTVVANITAGGGVSTVNVNGGKLVVSNFVGTAAAPLTALTLASASLHLKVNGTNTATAGVNAAAVSAAGTTITIDSVANVTGPVTVHLLSYSGTDPFAGLSLAPLPAGYTGNLVDNPGSIDLSLTLAAAPPSPSIRNLVISGGQVIITGTNNNGAGGSYHLLTSTNVALPLSNWTVLGGGSFDANGNFSSTNLTGTNNQQFYRLQVP